MRVGNFLSMGVKMNESIFSSKQSRQVPHSAQFNITHSDTEEKHSTDELFKPYTTVNKKKPLTKEAQRQVQHWKVGSRERRHYGSSEVCGETGGNSSEQELSVENQA